MQNTASRCPAMTVSCTSTACPLADMVLLPFPTCLCCQVVFGILGGLIAGLILGCTRLFCTRNKRLVSSVGQMP